MFFWSISSVLVQLYSKRTHSKKKRTILVDPNDVKVIEFRLYLPSPDPILHCGHHLLQIAELTLLHHAHMHTNERAPEHTQTYIRTRTRTQTHTAARCTAYALFVFLFSSDNYFNQFA